MKFVPRVALVVDDEPVVRRSVVRALRHSALIPDVREARNAETGIAELDDTVELLVCDMYLGDASGRVVLEAARMKCPRAALVVISGQATSTEAYDLISLGVGAFLEKPLKTQQLLNGIGAAQAWEKYVSGLASASVGKLTIKETTKLVRLAIYEQALKQCGGNKHATARLLDVDRRSVQLAAAELGFEIAPEDPNQ